MPQTTPTLARTGKVVASLAIASAVIATGYKANELSADPAGEKDCDLVFSATDPAGALTAPIETPADALVGAPPTSELLTWKQKGGTINDVSCLDRTPVYGVVQVTRLEDLSTAIKLAQEKNLKISMAGARHSMGGQAFYRNALVLDMTQFNQMSLDEDQRVLTVQSGATWHTIQNYLHPKYAVKAMQSTDIFTVGGSISVNAHGMDHRAGSVGSTLRSLRVMLADGQVVRVSRAENPELFDLVVGGYGLFGIIVDAEIEITDNVVYQTERQVISYREFPDLFTTEILPDEKLGLFYGHLSTASDSLLDEMILYKYTLASLPGADIPPLGEVSSTRLRRLVLNFSKLGDFPMRLKWLAEKHLEPRMEACTVVPRTQAMAEGEACFVSRNEPMHDSVAYTRNDLQRETDILHEYFIPREQFVPFIDGLRQIVQTNKVNLLNASVRILHPEHNFLNYAPAEMYSIVLYINQPTTPEGNAHMRTVTRQLIDLTSNVNGRFFLPYQLHYTPEQLRRVYPEIDQFFELKQKYDPEGRFTNTFYETYNNLPAP